MLKSMLRWAANSVPIPTILVPHYFIQSHCYDRGLNSFPIPTILFLYYFIITPSHHYNGEHNSVLIPTIFIVLFQLV